MNYIELSILAVSLAKEIYCTSTKDEIIDAIKFLNLLNDNLQFLLCGKDKEKDENKHKFK